MTGVEKFKDMPHVTVEQVLRMRSKAIEFAEENERLRLRVSESEKQLGLLASEIEHITKRD